MTDGPPRPDSIGTVAEEAAKLIALLGQRSAERTPAAAPTAGAREGTDDAYAGRAAYERTSPADDTCREHPRAGEALTCALCPICQGIAVLRTLNPETVDRLADLATAAAAALRELAVSTASAASSASSGAGRGARASGSPSERAGRPRTVDIEVVDDEEQYP